MASCSNFFLTIFSFCLIASFSRANFKTSNCLSDGTRFFLGITFGASNASSLWVSVSCKSTEFNFNSRLLISSNVLFI
jgi:hypothetical protein